MDSGFIEQSFVVVITISLILLGMLGSILPVLPGFILSYVGFLVFYFFSNAEISNLYPILFGLLGLASFVLNYYFPSKITKKYGGTRYGSIGSFLGTVLGFIFIPFPFGFLIGMILGVYLGELLQDKNNQKKAFDSTKGALIGFLYSVGFNLSICFAMLLVVLVYSFKNII